MAAPPLEPPAERCGAQGLRAGPPLTSASVVAHGGAGKGQQAGGVEAFHQHGVAGKTHVLAQRQPDARGQAVAGQAGVLQQERQAAEHARRPPGRRARQRRVVVGIAQGVQELGALPGQRDRALHQGLRVGGAGPQLRGQRQAVLLHVLFDVHDRRQGRRARWVKARPVRRGGPGSCAGPPRSVAAGTRRCCAARLRRPGSRPA
ncbi:Uncharacterised protein [Bordetella pertussis]|nr:Uncharacterised protein [Bordetella pertussis]